METVTETRYRGLCSMCRQTASCTFPRVIGQPVIDCLEFVGVEAASGRRHSRAPEQAALGLVLGTADDRGEPKGLCRTCDRLAACAFPKLPSGVWFCEEYA